MATRKIMNYKEHDILRKKSRTISNVDQKILTLIDDMAETMYNSSGVGLAAPQVGILKRIIIIDIGEGLIKLINPELIEEEGEQIGPEGCLSVPDIIGEVNRPERVKVSGIDIHSNKVILEGTGLLARAFCHEIDHLNGVLFIDKIISGSKQIIKNGEEITSHYQG